MLIREVAEWFKAHAWKACILEMESRVRIPSSLQFFLSLDAKKLT